jgi:hypothetical protein
MAWQCQKFKGKIPSYYCLQYCGPLQNYAVPVPGKILNTAPPPDLTSIPQYKDFLIGQFTKFEVENTRYRKNPP